jgi:hypothetical protein
MQCPLCDSKNLKILNHRQVSGEIFHCQECDLIFKSPELYLSWHEQKTRYDLHKNEINNPGYVEFFEQLLRPLREFLIQTQEALDWGSGPGENPVLAELLRREDLKVDLYDPVYQKQLPTKNYDLITCTEVVEHFQYPKSSFKDIFQHLKPQGIFAGLTQFHQGAAKFSNWWYAKDPTHVVFYSDKTFHWLAKRWNLKILHLQNPVFIFKRDGE